MTREDAVIALREAMEEGNWLYSDLVDIVLNAAGREQAVFDREQRRMDDYDDGIVADDDR